MAQLFWYHTYFLEDKGKQWVTAYFYQNFRKCFNAVLYTKSNYNIMLSNPTFLNLDSVLQFKLSPGFMTYSLRSHWYLQIGTQRTAFHLSMLWRLLKISPRMEIPTNWQSNKWTCQPWASKSKWTSALGDVPGLLVRATAKCSSELLAAGDPKTESRCIWIRSQLGKRDKDLPACLHFV